MLKYEIMYGMVSIFSFVHVFPRKSEFLEQSDYGMCMRVSVCRRGRVRNMNAQVSCCVFDVKCDCKK